MNDDCPTDQLRIKYGFWVVIIGLGVILSVFLIAISKWTVAADVAAVVGSVTGVVGTLVGAFFGIQVGSAGKEKLVVERNIAEERALKFAAALPPDVAAKILNINL